MSALATPTAPFHNAFAPPAAQSVGGDTALQRLALVVVWIAVASGAVVFSEPAPVDAITMGLIIGLPLVGLVTLPPALWVIQAVWAVCGAGALVGSSFAPDLAKSLTHTLVSIYLYAAFFIFAGFVAHSPGRHTRLILDAWLWAAFLGAVAGVVGYFNLAPGAYDLFTRYGRATGTFKDANVFGPFLVPALIWSLHKVLNEPLRRTLSPLIMLMFLSFALLLSFSRGAWLNAAIALAVYLYGAVVFAPSSRQRIKLVVLGAIAVAAAGIVLVAAAQTEAVGELLANRAALTQDYDVGPEGRFGGQEKAKGLILSNPLGIGAQTFAPVYHHEEPHNVYLTIFLNAGWAGGFAFLAAVWMTVVFGFGHALKEMPARPLFLIVFGAFLGNVAEGFIIDLDHWRHFYLEMGMVWGLMLGERAGQLRALSGR